MPQVTSLTRKGQVTIPKEVREQLSLKPFDKFDKIEVKVEAGEARLRKARPSVEEIAGTLPPLGVEIEAMPSLAREERLTGRAKRRK